MRYILTATAVLGIALGGSASAQEGDAAAGKKVFNKCKACHVVDKEQNRVGPYLHGVIGRKSGTAEGFKYSDAMKGADITWDDETIGAYLKDPKGYVPGNKMAFAGLKKDEDVANVLAYLHEAGGEGG
ncbi:MAG: cytochrome c family protein [Geminicoccaceae bacterium]|nr:cytochrome c family protein [Geminicoccaceae bacterium]